MTDTEFDPKFDYYETVREELGLRAIWSIYEIDNLSERHPYKGVTHLAYEDWSGKSIVIAINGSTYAALFVAANAAITQADTNHNFIEAFTQIPANPSVLLLTTGS